MLRTTVMLPESLKMKAEHAATERGISLGELIRNSLELTCANQTTGQELFFNDEVLYEGEDVPSNLAKNHDDFLY